MPHRRRYYVRALIGTYLLFVVLFLLYPRATSSIGTTGAAPVRIVSDEPLAFDTYGMREDAFAVTEGTVKRNDTFSDILGRGGIPARRVHEIAEAARPALDARRIRAGNAYRFYASGEALDTPAYFVYEKNAIDFVVLDLRDTLRVIEGRRAVQVRQQQAAGPIDGSLYVTLQEQGKNPLLAVDLSEVFAWQVDFYRIMKGDAFSAVYEEQYIDGASIGIDKVLAARFVHQGRTYTAYRFEHDGRVDYYDEDGNGLRRPFLRAPLKYSRISSRYSGNRFHPVLKRYKAHLGTDYAAPVGTPVRATADGVVLEASYTKNNGRYVKLKHNSTYTTGYLHLSGIANGVKNGVFVKQGDVIGYVGSTGLATGPHLCYRFWKNGVQVDPLRQELPDTAEPLPESYRPAFEQMKAELAGLL
ncbi:MAG: peptidoglycan DD-metalloendopeptidase family protein [Rhodothermales bacterium]